MNSKVLDFSPPYPLRLIRLREGGRGPMGKLINELLDSILAGPIRIVGPYPTILWAMGQWDLSEHDVVG